MAEEVKNVVTAEQINEAVERVKNLQEARKNLDSLNATLESRQKELEDAQSIYGQDSKEYAKQKEYITLTEGKIADAEKKVAELSYKKSKLKPVLDELTKNFETVYKEATQKEYHIELAEVKTDEDGKFDKENSGNGKKVYKQLLEYLYHNVEFTAKTVAQLMILVRNMEANKAWVNSQEFDNVIILRSASVLSLQNFMTECVTGHGYYDARVFLECWANCGQSVAEAVRQINKDNAESREVASKLTLVEDEFGRSEDDLPHDEAQMTTQEEVAPEVAE